MKKIPLIGLAFLMLLFVNCKKDSSSDDDGDGSTTLKPVPVTVTSSTNSPIVSPLNLENLLQSTHADKSAVLNINATETMNIEYEAGTRLILKKNITSGSDLVVDEYFYKDRSKGLLDSIVETKNGNFAGVKKYTIDSNDNILKIETFDSNRLLTGKYEYSNYNGFKPQRVSIFSSGLQGNVDVSGNMTYTGDNLTSMSLSGTFGTYNVTIAYDMTYDNKHLPFNNVETKEDVPIYVNNTTLSTATVNVAGNNLTTTTTFTHDYNSDDYPISTSVSVSSINGTENSTLEYVYEDK